MKLVAVNPNDFKRPKVSKNLDIIDLFIASGYSMARLDGVDKEYVSAESCVSSLNASIKRFNKAGLIKASMINGNAFLINLTKVIGGENNA